MTLLAHAIRCQGSATSQSRPSFPFAYCTLVGGLGGPVEPEHVPAFLYDCCWRPQPQHFTPLCCTPSISLHILRTSCVGLYKLCRETAIRWPVTSSATLECCCHLRIESLHVCVAAARSSTGFNLCQQEDNRRLHAPVALAALS